MSYLLTLLGGAILGWYARGVMIAWLDKEMGH